jgi:putative copper export protein/mono/diheme cytochrome c family protein
MSTLEIFVALLRGAHVAALVSLVGTLVFLTLVAPSAMSECTIDAPVLRLRLLRLARINAAFALIFGIAWLTVESAVIAGVDGVAMTLHALTVVASRTQFGQWLLVRGSLLLLALLFLTRWRPGNVVAAVVAAAALAVQPMLGHAGALGGSVGTTLILSEILHLLAAGAWLGSLLPLFITIGTLPHIAAAKACRNFTPVGLVAVLLLAGTAVVQVTEFMGGLPGLLGTGYGQVALIKLGLFVVLLGLAALNRLALTDRLAGSAPDTARRHMRVSVAVEMALGLLVVITAGFLASHAPGTHEQPVWPFARRPSLSIFSEPDLRGEVIVALVAVGASVVIAIAGLIWRKVRWPALVVAAIILALAEPHLDLLFIEAYPTTFYTSPTDFAVTAIVHGAKLYAANCVTCHGPEGRGDGPAAKSLPERPADLTAPHLLAHTEGDLFWFVAHGIDAPNGQLAMPGFSGAISSDGIWALLDYLRVHHAGMTMRTGGSEAERVMVPQFDAICADGTAVERADLRGHVLRIAAMPEHAPPLPALPPVEDINIRTILLVRHPPRPPPDSTCVTVEPEAWTAFAILLGTTPDELAGAEMLADADLWLRAFWRSGDAGNWNDPRKAAAIIRDIAAHPLAPATGGGHAHQH